MALINWLFSGNLNCPARMTFTPTLAVTMELMYYIVTIQEVKQQYEKWNADRTTLEIRFEDDPSPVIRA